MSSHCLTLTWSRSGFDLTTWSVVDSSTDNMSAEERLQALERLFTVMQNEASVQHELQPLKLNSVRQTRKHEFLV